MPDEGCVLVMGQPSDTPLDWSRVGYMFQDDRLLPWRVAVSNVSLRRHKPLWGFCAPLSPTWSRHSAGSGPSRLHSCRRAQKVTKALTMGSQVVDRIKREMQPEAMQPLPRPALCLLHSG